MAAAASLTACSTNDVIGDAGNGGDGIVTADDQQVIGIGTSINALSSQNVGTRATIGGVGTTENKWPAETKLYFFMLKKESLDPAQEGATDAKTNIFFDTEAKAPANVDSGKVQRTDSKIKYYPLADSRTVEVEADGSTTTKTLYGFDFYGYHDGGAVTRGADGAAAAKYYTATVNAGDDNVKSISLNTGATEKTKDHNVVGVPFEIDGSHDLMSGKAELTEDQKASLKIKVGEATDATDYTGRAYSAFAARRGVQPIIDFKHRLTRLAFNIKPGNASTAGYAWEGQQSTGSEGSWVVNDTVNAMQVTGISVKGKLAKSGVLVVATTNDDVKDSPIVWGTAEETEFMLKDSNGTEISENSDESLTGTFTEKEGVKVFEGTSTQIGDALMLQPGYSEYEVYITLYQKVAEKTDALGKDNDSKKVAKTQTIHGTIKLGDGKVFEAGSSYAVNVTVYGFEHIDITAKLTPWENGGTIESDTDFNDWKQE